MNPGNHIPRASTLIAVLLLTGACLSPREDPEAGLGASEPLDLLVLDLCNKTVVMLGEENHHGGGRTAEIKADLVQGLIDRCGFDAVGFESSVYEFVDPDRRLITGTRKERWWTRCCMASTAIAGHLQGDRLDHERPRRQLLGPCQQPISPPCERPEVGVRRSTGEHRIHVPWADWSLVFDGVVVLREEKPQSIDRPATPRFVPPAARDQG